MDGYVEADRMMTHAAEMHIVRYELKKDKLIVRLKALASNAFHQFCSRLGAGCTHIKACNRSIYMQILTFAKLLD